MNTEKIIIATLLLLVIVTITNSFLIFSISSANIGQAITGQVIQSAQISQDDVSRIASEVIPKGKPEYGDAARVSFDSAEASIKTLAGYDANIVLDGEDRERYIKIGTTRGTACEFCCGIGENGFAAANGQLACGCEHNIAFSGLTKWLIKNTDYTDDQIVQEIQKWKATFFPGPTVKKELQTRGMSASSGLPQQVGGC